MTIIGFTGRMNSGKTTAAKRVGGVRVSFATTLKRMVGVLLDALGYDPELINTQEGKETLIPELGVTVRYLLQTLGTEWGRKMIHPDMWALIGGREAVQKERVCGQPVVFDDVRFENEAAVIRMHGGHVVHIERSDLPPPTDDHESEAGLKTHWSDAVIATDGDVETLKARVDDLMRGL